MIQPGTLCYLIALTEKPEMIGRVVEVVSPIIEAEDGSGPCHQVDSVWLREKYPGHECQAHPSKLQPIAGPLPEAPRTGEPVTQGDDAHHASMHGGYENNLSVPAAKSHRARKVAHPSYRPRVENDARSR